MNHQSHLWTTPTNAPTTSSTMTTSAAQQQQQHSSMDVSRMNNNNNNNNNSGAHNLQQQDSPNIELRQIQRMSQMEDEIEHIQVCNDSQRELLQDTLHRLRQRIQNDMEHDNWKYDIVR